MTMRRTDHTLKLIQRHLLKAHPRYCCTGGTRGKHLKYRICHRDCPLKRTIVASVTPSEKRSNRNLISHLNHAIASMEREMEVVAAADSW
jgi:hypothetical protein